MEIKIKRTIAILLLVFFLVSLTATAVSAVLINNNILAKEKMMKPEKEMSSEEKMGAPIKEKIGKEKVNANWGYWFLCGNQNGNLNL